LPLRLFFYITLFANVLVFYSCKEKTSSGDFRSPFQIAHQQANAILEAGYIDSSFRFLDSSYQSIQPDDNADLLTYYEFCYNYYRREHRDYQTALLYADSMLSVMSDAGTSGYSERIARAYSSRGDALFSLGMYDKAYSNYYQGRMHAVASHNICAIADQDYRLGMVLYRQERYKQASDYFKLSLEGNKNCEQGFVRFYRHQELLDNIGLSYHHMGRNDSAIYYYRKTLEYIDSRAAEFPANRQSRMDQARAVVYGNMATAYYKAGKDDEADALLMKSIAINSKPGNDNLDAQTSRLKLANHHLATGRNAEAEDILNDIRIVSEALYDDDIALGMHKAMSVLYEKQNNKARAYDHLLSYSVLKETLDAEKKRLIETDINERFKNLQKEQQINRLAESNKRKQEYLVALLLGGALSLIIGALIIINWRRARKNVVVLSRLNKQIQEQNTKLEETLDALARSNKEKDRILHAVSHDIRNPVLAVSSLAELMQNDTDSYNAEHAEFISLIQEACNHALAISNDLIEIASAQRSPELKTEAVNISSLTKGAIDLLKFRAAQKQLQLSFEGTGNIEVYADREKMIRVVSNLITNAIKFTPEGGSIDVRLRTDDTYAIIEIRDSGIGIPKELGEKIFDTFTEAKRPGTNGEQPFGLGLSLAKQIVLAHKGNIRFESRPGQGTVFYISVPLIK
jgi:two-component system sensor histidine kinase VicK